MLHLQYQATPKFNAPSSVPSNTSTTSNMFHSAWPTTRISPLFTVYTMPRSARNLRHHVFRSTTKLPRSVRHRNYNTLGMAYKLFHAERHVCGINTASNLSHVQCGTSSYQTSTATRRLPCDIQCLSPNYI